MNKEQEVRLWYIKDILKNIIDDKDLSRDLIFKWGTSLMLFYDLDRFSEDLDFNYTDVKTISIIEKKFKSLWYKFINEETPYWRKFSIEYWNWEDKFHCIVDLSKYNYEIKPKTDLKSFWWKPIKVLTLSQNFAHKLCAFYERKKWRDVVDINFYMSKLVFPDENILKERHNKDFKDFLCLLIKELQTPYLNERLSKALDQLHYKNHTLSDYKEDIINNISKSYTNSKFSFDLNYKEKLNKWIKIILLNKEITLFIDWKNINNNIKEKYSIVNSENFWIIYDCKTEEKLFSYINNILVKEKLIVNKSNLIKLEIW